MKKWFIGIIFALLATGCQFENIDGEACKYLDFEEIAEIVSVGESQVVAKGGELSYEIPLVFFESPPLIGNEVIVRSKRITSGSCTPVMIQTVAYL